MMKQQHYRMTLEEAIALHQCGLISSTALLYCYLRIRLAPGWKITLHQREISQQLGISKAAFYKGIQRLKDKKLIDWEAPNGVVVILGQNGDSLDKSETVGQIGDSLDKSETSLDKMETLTPSKTLPVKASVVPSDYYQIFIKSLSDTAREKFFNFVREKVKDFNPPIHDIEAWLAGKNGAGKERSRVYYEMFQSEVGEADWENHPKREEWIAEIRQGKGRFVAQGGPPEKWETRKAFADWAITNNLVWGNKS
ncbi:MAG: hypothetical protein O9326_14185 [Microcystis sp. LE19-338.1B]|nr:hypothetical protein [Microcystis sp. LE19-338.1B]